MLLAIIWSLNIIVCIFGTNPITSIIRSKTAAIPMTRKEFPLGEFLGFKDSQELVSKYAHLCNKPFSYDEDSSSCCSCNLEECMKYGTCCVDILWDFNEVSLDKYFNKLFEEKSRHIKLSCEQLVPTENLQSKHYYMVNTCPPGADSFFAKMCTSAYHGDNEIHMPIFGDDQYLYQNEFCAYCNSITSFEPIDMDIRCMDAGKINGKRWINSNDIKKLRNCTIEPTEQVFKKNLKTCKKDKYCKKDNTNYKLCNTYYGPLGPDKYRNIHCFKCRSNGTEDIESLLRNSDCFKPTKRDDLLYTYSFKLRIDHFTNKMLVLNYSRKFPIIEFFGFTYHDEISDKEAFHKYLCSYKSKEKCCRCDKDCMKRRDCCIDFFWSDSQALKLDVYLDIFQNKSRMEPRCEYVYPNFKKCEWSEAIYMVKSCPFGSNIKSMNECYSPNEDILNNIPVIGKDKKVYGNIGCAHCNEVFDYSYVTLSLECKQTKILETKNDTNPAKSLIEKSRCSYRLAENNELFHRCTKRTTRECHFLNENYELCNSYFGEIYSYANYHCAKCNGELNVIPPLEWWCLNSNPPVLEICSSKPIATWSLLISFIRKYPKVRIVKHKVEHSPCRKGESFEIESFKCVEKCKQHQQPINGVCNSIKQNIELSGNYTNYTSCLTLRRNKLYLLFQNYTNDTKDVVTDVFHDIIPNSTFNVKLNNSLMLNSSLPNWLLLESNKVISSDILRKIESSANLKPGSPIWHQVLNCFVSPEINPIMFTTMYSLDPARYFPGNRLCHQYKQFQTNKTTFEPNCNVTSNKTTISYENISMWIDLKHGIKGIATCKQFHLTEICPRFFLPANVTLDKKFNVIIPGKVGSDDQQKVFTPEEYQPVNDSFTVCRSTIKNIYEPDPTNSKIHSMKIVEEKVSLIGSSISIVAYLWIIATYLGLKELRTLPGYSYAFMCTYLLLADSLFMVVLNINLGRNFCITLAVLLHWSLVGSFMWTIVIAYDLVSKFTSFSRRSSSECIKQVKRRVLITFFSSTIYISILVVFDQLSPVTIGYGTNICWISNFYARLASYIVPVGVISLLTFIALIYTTIKIQKDQKDNSNVLQMKRRSNLLKVALKLVVIFGTTELIGYIQIPNPTVDEEVVNSVFSLIYTVSRSLRGALLAFVLIFGRDVMKKYKNRFKGTIKQCPHLNETEAHQSHIANMETSNV